MTLPPSYRPGDKWPDDITPEQRFAAIVAMQAEGVARFNAGLPPEGEQIFIDEEDIKPDYQEFPVFVREMRAKKDTSNA